MPATAGLAFATGASRIAGAAAGSRAAQHGEPVITALAERLWLVSGLGGNVVVFGSTEGVLLVDGGADGQTPALLQTVHALTGSGDVHTLVNTHWHHEHTGANTTLGPAGARIVAHENTRLWLGTDVDSRWDGHVYRRLPKQALPNQTFYTTTTLEFGGETIDCGYLPQAHTDGDLYAYFRRANLLVAGDVARLVSYPELDYSTNGWITGMVNGLAALSALGDEATRVVPGTGDPIARAQLKEQSDMLVAVRLALARQIAQGRSLDEAKQEQPTRQFDARWGDPERFLASAWAGMVRRPQELGQAVV